VQMMDSSQASPKRMLATLHQTFLALIARMDLERCATSRTAHAVARMSPAMVEDLSLEGKIKGLQAATRLGKGNSSLLKDFMTTC